MNEFEETQDAGAEPAQDAGEFADGYSQAVELMAGGLDVEGAKERLLHKLGLTGG